VYQWALSQSLYWIHASDYVNKVNDANATLITSTSTGFTIDNNEVKEFRLPYEAKFPDLIQSQNIIGYQVTDDVIYLHAGPAHHTQLILRHTAPKEPYLANANGKVTAFTRTSHGLKFHLIGYLPLNFTLENVSGCTLKTPEAWFFKSILPQSTTKTSKTYHLKATDSHEIELDCQS
jgi:hypothetical protein